MHLLRIIAKEAALWLTDLEISMVAAMIEGKPPKLTAWPDYLFQVRIRSAGRVGVERGSLGAMGRRRSSLPTLMWTRWTICGEIATTRVGGQRLLLGDPSLTTCAQACPVVFSPTGSFRAVA